MAALGTGRALVLVAALGASGTAAAGLTVTAHAGAPLSVTHAALPAPARAAAPATRRGVMPMTRRNPASRTGNLAPHLTYYGGPVVTSVHVVQVLYGSGSGATFAPYVSGTGSGTIASFYRGVTNSTYMDLLSEYDTTNSPQGQAGTNQTIVRGTFDAQVQITPLAADQPVPTGTGTAVLDDTQIQAEIQADITTRHTLPAPVTDSSGRLETLYAVYIPEGVTVTQAGQRSGVDFCAYHGDTSVAAEAYYSVLPDFGTGGMATGCGPGTQYQNDTAVSSHELAETITDPQVGLLTSVNPGPPLAWYDPNNGEIGDICNQLDGTVTGGDGVAYTVQKLWSNAQNNCVLGPPPPPPPPPFAPPGVGAPQVAVTPDGSTQLVFWKGAGGVLTEAWYTGRWNGPVTFPQLGALSSAPAVAVSKDGSTQLVFWQGAGGHLEEAWYTGTWHGPVDWTASWGGRGILASAPSVVPMANGEQLVFWRGTDAHLWEAWYSGSWNGPVDFTNLGTLASTPSAAITPDGSTQLVFWQGVDNRLTEAWFTGSWHGPVEWTQLGAITSPPSVAVTPDGSTQLVFYQSPAGHLLEDWYTGSWHGPADFTTSAFGGQGLLTSPPSAAVTPDGSTQLVFWQGAGESLWEGWYAAGSWHGPVDFSA